MMRFVKLKRFKMSSIPYDINKAKLDKVPAEQVALWPYANLPARALAYARILCQEVGGCGEVIITGIAHYLQAEQGFGVKDSLYKLNSKNRKMYLSKTKEIDAITLEIITARGK